MPLSKRTLLFILTLSLLVALTLTALLIFPPLTPSDLSQPLHTFLTSHPQLSNISYENTSFMRIGGWKTRVYTLTLTLTNMSPRLRIMTVLARQCSEATSISQIILNTTLPREDPRCMNASHPAFTLLHTSEEGRQIILIREGHALFIAHITPPLQPLNLTPTRHALLTLEQRFQRTLFFLDTCGKS